MNARQERESGVRDRGLVAAFHVERVNARQVHESSVRDGGLVAAAHAEAPSIFCGAPGALQWSDILTYLAPVLAVLPTNDDELQVHIMSRSLVRALEIKSVLPADGDAGVSRADGATEEGK